MKTKLVVLAVVAMAGIARGASAQTGVGPTTPFSLEVDANLGIPTGDFSPGVNAGLGATGRALFQAMPMLGVYAGYTWNSFGTDNEGTGYEVSIRDMGLDAGIRLSVAPAMRLAPFVQGGVVYHKVELVTSREGGSAPFKTDSGLGFDVGAGVSFPLGARISVVPSAGFTRYTIDTGAPDDLTVSYARASIGLNFRI